jgi:ferredoxin-NADP reductase
MIVGAGIGVTPCCAILTALLKYRWRKNFNPVRQACLVPLTCLFWYDS